jgi:hypothetical protein
LVDVTVRNIDDSGVLIPGETVTEDDAYTFMLPDLTDEEDLTRVVRTFLRQLKQQVLPNVQHLPHTDWSDDPASGIPFVAQLPALIVHGPRVVENRFYSENEESQEQNGSGTEFDQRQVPLTVDLTFTVIGVTDSHAEMLNLLAVTKKWHRRSKWLKMLRDASDPDSGIVKYEMDVLSTSPFAASPAANDSNIRSFSGEVVVRGVDLEGLATFADDRVVDRGGVVAEDGVVLEVENTGDTYPIGPSPGR